MTRKIAVLSVTLAVVTTCGTASSVLAAEPNFQLLQTFTNGHPMDLYMNYSVYVKDNWAFDLDYNGGYIYSLRRDTSDGTLTYLSGRRLSADANSSTGEIMGTCHLSPQNILYVSCFMSHASNNSASKGILYYQIDPTTGAFTLLGQIPCPLGFFVDSGDPYRPWFISRYDGTIYEVVIDPTTGTPSIGPRVCSGTAMGAPIGTYYAISTDHTSFYCLTGNKIGLAAIGPDNSLTYQGYYDLSSYGLLDCRCIVVSYDGRHVYAPAGIESFPKTYGLIGIFKRDPATGALTWQENQPCSEDQLYGQLIAHRDNTHLFFMTTYYIGGRMGWMTRDPATGHLTLSNNGVGCSPDGGNNIVFTPGTGTLYGTSWYTQSLLVINTNVPASAAPDTTAPAPVADLSAAPHTLWSVTASWTAPGDDGTTGTASFYDLRYSTEPVTDANWDTAIHVDNVTYPQVAGSAESFVVDNLIPGTDYYLAIKSMDPWGNVSAISDVAHVTTPPPDPTPPAAVTDLAASVVSGSRMVTVTWTATGDDGAAGTALRYDLRYSTDPITDMASFDAATAVTGLPDPQPAGSAEQFTITTLAPGVTYNLAIIAYDKGENPSPLSNVVSITTAADIPPAAITDLAAPASSITKNSVQLTWTAPGEDGSAGTATRYDLRYTTLPITDMTSFLGAAPVPGVGVPQPAGSSEQFTVTGLAPDTAWYFAIVAYDAADQPSGVSNVVEVTTAPLDPPPAAITDLTVQPGTIAQS